MQVSFTDLLNQNVRHVSFILPEAMVVATFLFALVFDFVVAVERRKSTAYICILGLLVAMWLALRQNHQFAAAFAQNNSAQSGVVPLSIFGGMLTYDHFGTFFKLLILLGTIVTLLLSIHAKELQGKNHGEFFLLALAVCAGGMFLSSSSNLLMSYLSLESLSIISYAMAGFLRRDRKSAEAGIKYVIYGAMASGIMIYGMSYLYGLTGTLNICDYHPDPRNVALIKPGIATQFTQMGLNDIHSHGATIAVLVMVFSGFLYKIAAVPFHYWSPDVYEGSPTTATAFFSVVPKAAGFAVLIRVLCKFFPANITAAQLVSYPRAEVVIGVLAALTMTLGNLSALGQTNVKRMLAYSSIAHAGYMLAGLSVLDDSVGPAMVLFYLVVYLFMNLGAFMVIVALENTFGGSDLGRLRGAVRREPVLVVALCVFLFSLTGLPPFGGFIGKYLIMWKLADRERYAMIFCIGINSVISLYYYMRIAKAVAIDAPEQELEPAERAPVSLSVVVLCKCFALLLLFFYFEPVRQLCLRVMTPLR
jgi:NADH-quinone oxidoreductase subunit N